MISGLPEFLRYVRSPKRPVRLRAANGAPGGSFGAAQANLREVFMKLNLKDTVLTGFALLSVCAFWRLYDGRSVLP